MGPPIDRYILKPDDLEKVKDRIRDVLDDLGIDFFYYEARGGIQVIEDRKRREF